MNKRQKQRFLIFILALVVMLLLIIGRPEHRQNQNISLPNYPIKFILKLEGEHQTQDLALATGKSTFTWNQDVASRFQAATLGSVDTEREELARVIPQLFSRKDVEYLAAK